MNNQIQTRHPAQNEKKMGTLLHQEPRKFNKVDFEVLCEITNDLDQLCIEAEIKTDTAIKIYELAELRRRNNLYVINGDIHDEQMAGFGEMLNEILNILRTFQP